MGCAYVSGPVEVQVNLRDGNGFVHLGYTVDGVQPEEIFYTVPVHSDQYGGSGGPEIDRQFMGKTARISLSLVYYDLAVIKKLRHGQNSENWSTNDQGQLVDVGGLVTCGNRAFQVLLIGSSDTAATAASSGTAPVMTLLNYPNCWYDGPVKFPLGSKHTVFDFDIKATPFTSDTTNYGNGKTYLYLPNNHLVTDMSSYDDTTQSA